MSAEPHVSAPHMTRIYVPSRKHCALVTEDERLVANFRRYGEGDGGVEFVGSAQQADVIVLFEQFSFKLWDYKDSLRNCSSLRRFAEKIFTVNYDDYGRGFLPGCYTSLSARNFDPAVHRACAYPKSYNEVAESAAIHWRDKEPRWLFSFCGTVQSHPVRRDMVKTLSARPEGRIEQVDQAFHHHTAREKTNFVEQALDSAFVLCPRGWSPSTYRLFEVMALGRCPVIISDQWVPTAGVAWDECSIRVREADVAHVPAILARRRGDAQRLGANARKVWEECFSVESRNKHYLHAVLDLYRTSREKAAIPFSERYAAWSSWRFYRSNGWTVPQRARSKLQKMMNPLLRRT